MKKLLVAVIAATLLLIASCDKSNSLTSNNTVNGWSFKGNTLYTLISKTKDSVLYAVNDTLGNYTTLSFVFPTLPTASGTYRVINHNTVPTGNQVTISLRTVNVTSVFNSIGNDNIDATVTVTNGKIAIAVPYVNLLSSTTSNDTSQLYATITQTQ